MHLKDCVDTLTKEFPKVSCETLLSIYSQCYQSYIKTVHGAHRKPEAMKKYYTWYTEAMSNKGSGGDEKLELLVTMSQKFHFSPSLFARIILEQYMLSHDLQPSSVPTASLVSQWVKNPGRIPDTLLQEQVKQCVLNDTNYGPLAENMKHSVGYEYEFVLQEMLEERQIPFLDEKVLRLRGYDKTPDFKLEVPVAVGDHVVNWIESKASFGDQQNHSRYLEEQFWSYQNRFGSGLVIYWFGFLEELDVHAKQGIKLLDCFPEDLKTLTA